MLSSPLDTGMSNASVQPSSGNERCPWFDGPIRLRTARNDDIPAPDNFDTALRMVSDSESGTTHCHCRKPRLP